MSNTGPIRENLIGRQLSWRVLVLSGIALVALLLASSRGIANTIAERRDNLGMAGAEVTARFDEFLEQMINDLWATADAVGVHTDADTLFIRALARQESALVALWWVSPDGSVPLARERGGLLADAHFDKQPWLVRVQADEVYVGELEYVNGAPLMYLAVPIKDPQHTLAGTLVAQVDLTLLWERVVTERSAETSLTYVIDRDQYLLFHPDVALALAGQRANFDVARMQNSNLLLTANLKGVPAFVVFNSVDIASWYVVTEMAFNEVVLSFVPSLFFPVFLIATAIFLGANTRAFVRREIVNPLVVLYDGVSTLRQGDLAYCIDVGTQGEFALLAETINALASQLYENISVLEQQVDERTRGLLAAAEVSRSTTSMLDPDVLLQQTVSLMVERFSLYYVGLFLLDASGQYAELRAGTGVAGAQMMAAKHRLLVGSETMIGQCVALGRTRIALDVGDEAQRFDNPLLPETRSEMALPLRSHRDVIGAMTVQSDKSSAFNEASILVMQTMADQVAVAIDNVRLYAQTQRALAEMQLVQQRYFGEAWAEFLQHKLLRGYKKAGDEMVALEATPLPGVAQALTQREPLVMPANADEGVATQVIVPIRFRDHAVGAVGFGLSESQPLSDEQIVFVEAIAEQFGQAAENLRLVDATHRLAAREHAVGEIAARMRQSLELDTVLKTAAEELRQALQTPEVTIRLKMLEDTDER